MAPVPGEDEGQFVALQRPVVVGEADPAVELGIACHPFFDAGHADEHQAGAGAVELVPEIFQRGGGQPFGFVDDEELDMAGPG